MFREKYKSDIRFYRYIRDFYTKRVGAIHKIPPFNFFTIYDFPKRTINIPKRRYIFIMDLAEDSNAIFSLKLVIFRRPRNSPLINCESKGGGRSNPRENKKKLQKKQKPKNKVRGKKKNRLNRKNNNVFNIKKRTPESDIVINPGFE